MYAFCDEEHVFEERSVELQSCLQGLKCFRTDMFMCERRSGGGGGKEHRDLDNKVEVAQVIVRRSRGILSFDEAIVGRIDLLLVFASVPFHLLLWLWHFPENLQRSHAEVTTCRKFCSCVNHITTGGANRASLLSVSFAPDTKAWAHLEVLANWKAKDMTLGGQSEPEQVCVVGELRCQNQRWVSPSTVVQAQHSCLLL